MLSLKPQFFLKARKEIDPGDGSLPLVSLKAGRPIDIDPGNKSFSSLLKKQRTGIELEDGSLGLPIKENDKPFFLIDGSLEALSKKARRSFDQGDLH